MNDIHSSYINLKTNMATITPIAVDKRKINQTMPTQFTLTITIFLILSLSTPTAPNQTKPKPLKKIYAFGDSFTDTGNTVSATGPNAFTYVSNLPYGRTFFHHPTNRYSDGRLVIDFITQSLSLPFLPPYLKKSISDTSYGINFAVAGSTAIRHSFFVKNNITLNITPQSLQTQLNWFNKTVVASGGCRGGKVTAKECRDVFGEALIWVGEIGANDYAYSFGSSVSSEKIQQLALRSVTGFLEAVLSKGAKYMVVQGLPPTGCLTLSLSLAPPDDRDDLGCVRTLNNQSFIHNSILQSKIKGLQKQYPESVIVYGDYWNAYRTIVKNASIYGFKELYKVCCGAGGGTYNFDLFGTCGSPSSSSCKDPSQYINWDGVHLTEAMYKLVAESFLDGKFSQPPFDYLLSRKMKSG